MIHGFHASPARPEEASTRLEVGKAGVPQKDESPRIYILLAVLLWVVVKNNNDSHCW